MTKLAVVDVSEDAVLDVFSRAAEADEVAIRYRLPNGDGISPLVVGWSDERYAVLPVIEFEAPIGKRAIGNPAYAIVDGEVFEAYDVEDVPVERPMVRKSTVQARLIAAGKMEAAYAALTSNPIYFARWFAPDRTEVYCDDPDALFLLKAVGADPQIVLAVE